MKYTDYNDFFSWKPADIALLSTYDFDPLYFEQRLLCENALKKARRIIVFMDYGRYISLSKKESYSRYFNDRYLVVPIYRPLGVFHPKLNILLGEKNALFSCGSSNLTQAGCTHNLELLNALYIQMENESELTSNTHLIFESIAFFKSCLEWGIGDATKIASQWLKELDDYIPWMDAEVSSEPREYFLVHTLKQNIWHWMIEQLKDHQPSRITVLSPFYDSNLQLLKKVNQKWPKCEVEIIAQNHTSNLPAKILEKMSDQNKLFNIEGIGGRRLHAKLISIIFGNEEILISGSANFTSAAFEGKNIETCFAYKSSNNKIEKLFDEEILKVPIEIKDFVPGKEKEPSPPEETEEKIKITSALINSHSQLTIQYETNIPVLNKPLALSLLRYGEEHPIQTIELPKDSGRIFAKDLDNEIISILKGAIRCYLVADSNGQRIKSAPCWLIQESHLTYNPSGSQGPSSGDKKVIETGEGLTEYVDGIYEKEGYKSFIEFLNNLNIRFSEGGNRRGKPRKPKPHDPTKSDDKQVWDNITGPKKDALEKAICDFVERHQKRILIQHAKRGNINGLKNFMDVFIETNQLIFLWYQRGILSPSRAVDKIFKNLSILAVENDLFDFTDIYLQNLLEMQKGNINLLSEVILSARVPGHVRGALLLVQIIRWEDDQRIKKSPSEYLTNVFDKISSTLGLIGLSAIDSNQVDNALGEYTMISESEKKEWLAYL